jgi:hypothetical protein
VGKHLALNSRGAVDPRWLTHNQAVGYALQLATVQIFNQASSEQEYDPVFNTWSGTTIARYTGPARIQPVNTVSETVDNYNPTFLKTVRVVIPYGKNTLPNSDGVVPDIRPNDRMIVTASPKNETLTKFIYTVTDVLNSSNAWERTLLCRVDTELDPTVI